MPGFNPVFAKFAVSKVDKRRQPIVLKLGSKAEVPLEEVKRERPLSLLLVIIGLFAISSLFQTLAWYYNVDGKLAFWTGFMFSMTFVFMEYLCMLPANQMGYKVFNLIQLGIMVELINWLVFILYVKYVRKEEITNRSWMGLAIMLFAVVVVYS